MPTITYNLDTYDTIEAAQAEATRKLGQLETNPSLWCEIKLLTPVGEDLYEVPLTAVPDADFLAAMDGVYSVYSQYNGANLHAVNIDEAREAVKRFRKDYINYFALNVIVICSDDYSTVESISTNADFSAYLYSVA